MHRRSRHVCQWFDDDFGSTPSVARQNPVMSVNSPLDLFRVYVTPSQHGIGRRLAIATIDERLALLPVGSVLNLLAQIAYRADDAINSVAAQRDLARQSLRPADAKRFMSLLSSDQRYAVMSSQVIVGLALHALVHCKDDPVDQELPLDVPRLVELVLALSDHAGSAANDHEIILEAIRLGLFFRLHDHDWWYEVAYRLLFEVLPSMRTHPQFVDVRSTIEQATSLDINTFWALTTIYGGVITQEPQRHRFPIPLGAGATVSVEDTERWASAFTIDLQEARTRATADLEHASLWSFGACFDRPLIRVGTDLLVAIRPQFVALKGTPLGLYDFVQRIIREAGGDTHAWSTFWGAAVEQFARTLMDEQVPSLPRLRDESAIRARWGTGRTCDTVFLGDSWIAIDFVKRRIRTVTSTSGGLEDLALDLRRGVLDKFGQIDATLARGLSRESTPMRGFYPLVVVGAPFPVNGLVMNEIDRMLDADGVTAIGTAGCRPPAVLDLVEFWLLLLTAQNQEGGLDQVLGAWLNSPLGVVPFRDWLVTNGPGQPGLDDDRRYQTHANRTLFGEL